LDPTAAALRPLRHSRRGPSGDRLDTDQGSFAVKELNPVDESLDIEPSARSNGLPARAIQGAPPTCSS
jgi:hypothetical protein